MKKRLLIHICCAPDTTVAVERLTQSWDIEGYFFNPNIHPREEYERRRGALETLAEITGLPFIEVEYGTQMWFEAIKGLEDEPEKGRRCEVCIGERLRATARAAVARGFDAFSAVFTVSPHKDVEMINRLGETAGKEYGIEYLPTNLKKQDGFRRSVELTRLHGIYRQDYCGCEYSRSRNRGRPASAGPEPEDQSPRKKPASD